jgi:hypothetical protein
MSESQIDRQQMANAALAYARRGWHVIPVGAGPDRKLPYIRNWTQEASTDAERIISWWSQFPTANIGIATGPISGFWVVDVDMKNGIDGLKSLMNRFGTGFDFDVEKYLVGKTATGGIHFLFQWDSALPVRNGQAVLPGVDIRGDGGQVVVAPSNRLIDGVWVNYRWNNAELPLSPITPWARALVTPPSGLGPRSVDVASVMLGLSQGSRDTELWRYACHLASRRVPMSLALSFMTVAAERCSPPFDPRIAADKVIRAYGEVASSEVFREAISSIEQELKLRKESTK